jgi:hypothetical protein
LTDPCEIFLLKFAPYPFPTVANGDKEFYKTPFGCALLLFLDELVATEYAVLIVGLPF